MSDVRDLIIDGVKIKRYKARVKDWNGNTTSVEPISEDGYRIVEGYVAINLVNIPTSFSEKESYYPIFVVPAPDMHQMICAGFDGVICKPVTFAMGEFEIIGEVE